MNGILKKITNIFIGTFADCILIALSNSFNEIQILTPSFGIFSSDPEIHPTSSRLILQMNFQVISNNYLI